jgi:hypothetical protein
MDISQKIRLTLQSSLIGNVSKRFRGICCDWSDDHSEFTLRVYTDIESNSKLDDLVEIILQEFCSEFEMQKFVRVSKELVYSLEEFSKLNKLKLVVFWHDEIYS